MLVNEVRFGRLILLFSTVLMVTAYLPHPNLDRSLPQSINSWFQTAEAEERSELRIHRMANGRNITGRLD
ncbi:MAG: hypothetical protein ACFBSG_12375 [Leptolyngbyaceae cyanobacterium]